MSDGLKWDIGLHTATTTPNSFLNQGKIAAIYAKIRYKNKPNLKLFFFNFYYFNPCQEVSHSHLPPSLIPLRLAILNCMYVSVLCVCVHVCVLRLIPSKLSILLHFYFWLDRGNTNHMPHTDKTKTNQIVTQWCVWVMCQSN